jgi:hypothetical protein
MEPNEAATHTHLDGLPPAVTITRRYHPLEGHALEVLGWQRRQGRLRLTLVLPDGSKSLIPAEWTDLEPRAWLKQPQALGSIADLLHARTVLTPLLGRLDRGADGDDARQSNKSEEVARAAAPGADRDPDAPPRVWDALTGEQQAVVVALLARLIAKTLLCQAKEADDAR